MKPSDFLTPDENEKFYHPLKTSFGGDGSKQWLLCCGHQIIIGKLFPSYTVWGLPTDYPRISLVGSKREDEQLQIRRVLMTIQRMEEGLSCLKGYTVELLEGAYNLLPQYLNYVPKGEALIGPDDSVRRDSDKTFQEMMHRFEALSRNICPDHYVRGLLNEHLRRAS